MLPSSILLFIFQIICINGFNIDSKSNIAVYWGQASAGSQSSLATYCQSSDVDIVMLSFLYEFPTTMGLNFASACTTTFSSGLLHCPQIGEDIKTCQSLGKKILLSAGGASGAYGFTSDSEAESFALTLWNTFGGGSADERPFDDAIVDGFDFDIENNNQVGYTSLVKKLREYFLEGSKPYYISAAPQCVYPDASVGDLLAHGHVDFAFIQFYNNYCNVGEHFNWDTWLKFAQNISPNKNIKLFLGLPGSSTAASTGYIPDLDVVKSTVDSIVGSDHFGGIAIWDASQCFDNEVEGKPYVVQMKSILDNASATTPISTISSISSTDTDYKSTKSSDLTITTYPTSSTSTLIQVQDTSVTPSPSKPSVNIPTFTSMLSTFTSMLSTLTSDSTRSHVTLTLSPTTAPKPSNKPEISTLYSTTMSRVSSIFQKESEKLDTSTTKASVELHTSIDELSLTTNVLTSTSALTTIDSSVNTIHLTPAHSTTSAYATKTSETSEESSKTQSDIDDTYTPISTTYGSHVHQTAIPLERYPTITMFTHVDTITTSLLSISTYFTTSGTTIVSPVRTVLTTEATPTSLTVESSSVSALQKAKNLNAQFAMGKLNGAPSCVDGELSCSSTGQIAVCNHGLWIYTECAAGTTCYASEQLGTVYISCNFMGLKENYL